MDFDDTPEDASLPSEARARLETRVPMTGRLFDLEGRVALITGAGQGVGAGIARTLASRGATVLVNDIDPERAASVAEAIVGAGGESRPLPFDVTDLAAVRDAVASVESVDILVNNAGNGGSGG